MTQDEIIRMAREVWTDVYDVESYEHFAALVAAHERERTWTEKDWGEAAEWIRQQEREACAMMCDVVLGRQNAVSAAIRARGEK